MGPGQGFSLYSQGVSLRDLDDLMYVSTYSLLPQVSVYFLSPLEAVLIIFLPILRQMSKSLL
jgi:hypothetical protein